MQTLRDGLVVRSRTMLRHRAVKVPMRINAIHFFLSAKLSNALLDRSHIDVSDLDTLITLQLKFIRDNFWRAFDCETLLRALAIYRASKNRLAFLFGGNIVIFPEEIKIIAI